MHRKTLTELAHGLAQKEFSSLELTNALLSRIDQHDSQLNSFISITHKLAEEAAQNADKMRAAGNATPLTGLPIAHKDIFCTQGVKTSCASKMLDNFIAPYESTATRKLKDAGMVMLGKLNMDEFAMGSSNENSFYGAVKNPWNLEYVPGGSSGGSSAAVAARLAPCATGTDTGGSIRQPAAYCGLTGIKPTYGRISRFGMIAFASSLDQGGIFTYDAQDAALLLKGLCGHDPRDSTSLNEPVPDFTKNLNRKLDGLKIGVPERFLDEKLNPDVSAKIEAALAEFTKLGCQIKKIRLPHIPLSIPVYYVVSSAECSSNLARFDGVRYGYRCDDPKNLEDLYVRSRSEGFGAEVKRRILIGTHVLSAGFFDAYYTKAQKIRSIIRDDFTAAFADVDVILGPTTPGPAFKIGEKCHDPIQMYLNDIYTAGVNLAGLPALSIPAGLVSNLPIGLQLIGNYLSEDLLLNMAHQYQLVTNWHNQIPEQFA